MAVKKIFLRAPFNYDVDAASDEAGLRCDDESRTQQQFKEDADINVLVRRFGIGEVPVVPVGDTIAELVDVTHVGDFRSLMDQVRAGQMAFDAQPAELRARFGNDPRRFVDFVLEDKNRDEAMKLGLLKSVDAPTGAAPAPAGGTPPPAPAAVKGS